MLRQISLGHFTLMQLMVADMPPLSMHISISILTDTSDNGHRGIWCIVTSLEALGGLPPWLFRAAAVRR